ncbi:MAG: hypothetical protein ACI8S6_003721 [Myxococcota bacterium]|jgi:hypothetical protein
MGRVRTAAFTLLAVGLGLGAIELLSAAAERTVLPLRRRVPTPSHLTGEDALIVPPEAHLALTEDQTKRWGLPVSQTLQAGDTQHRINAAGMRGPELPPRVAGEVRLLTLGDSSIYGDLVAEEAVFSRVAAGHLSAAWGCTVRDYNGGVPGYSSEQALTRLQELGPLVEPQLVIMGAMWSDVYSMERRHQGGEVDLAYLKSPLRRLATYRILRTLLAPKLSARRVRWIDGRDDIAPSEEKATVRLRAYLDNLRATAALAQELGAETVFLALPAPIDLDPAPVPETVQEYRAAMALVAEDTGSLLVDGPAWLAREGGTLALFADHVHPNELGHALLGYALAETLAARPPPAACSSR